MPTPQAESGEANIETTTDEDTDATGQVGGRDLPGEDAATAMDTTGQQERGGLAAFCGTLVAFFTSLFPGVLPAEQAAGGPFAEQNAHGF